MKYTLRFVLLYLRYILQWLLVAAVVGVCCGAVGAVFYLGVSEATALRTEYSWLLYLLPAAGLVIVWMYRKFGLGNMGTDAVIDAAREGDELPFRLLPAIFLGTLITHLFGGSAGREGAALQIGGVIANRIGTHLFHFDDQTMRIVTMCGMSAFFTALFGTPLTATMFVAMFVDVGRIYTAAVFPSLTASMIAFVVSRRLGMHPFRFFVAIPAFSPSTLLRVIALAALAGLVSTLFVKTLHFTAKVYQKYLKNPYLRAAVGGLLIVLLTFAVGTRDYNGAGTDVIQRALEDGKASYFAFLLKILFTAVTLEAGFKGGEIVPTFFIGAVFGCAFGPILGLPATFAAAVGLAAMFAGATNSIIASIFLALEVFGGGGILYFAAGCVISFIASAYDSLYGSQKIVFSKLRADELEIHPSKEAHENSQRVLEAYERDWERKMNEKRNQKDEDKEEK